MSELAKYSGIMILSVFVSAVSQVMLKKSANKHYGSKLKEYFNPVIIIAYVLFLSCTLISMYALKVVPLSMAPLLEATGYIFVALLSYVFLKERMSSKHLLGMSVIILGIVIYII